MAALAKMLNTYLKGDVLEAKAFELFNQMLKDERFYVPGKHSQLFRKAKYFSKDRNANITFDLSVETKLPGADKFSLLTLFECKNYDDSVQVGDVETFSDRVKQVGGHKGVMITATPFQRSALQIAKTRNIGIARINTSNQIEWLNYRRDEKDLSGIVSDLDDKLSGDKPLDSPILSLVDGMVFTSIQDMFQFLGIIDQYYPSLQSLSIPYKSDEDIQLRINELRLDSCYDHYHLNILRLCERISELYDADFDFDQIPSSFTETTIGLIQYNPLKISVNPKIGKASARWRFTVVHEIGHLILHSHILKDYFASNADSEQLQIMSAGISREIIKRMEIQANVFASRVIMPPLYFEKVVLNYFKRESINKPFLYWDNQKENWALVMTLLGELETIFGVSKEAAKIKLKSLGLLKGAVVTESVGDHLRAMGY